MRVSWLRNFPSESKRSIIKEMYARWEPFWWKSSLWVFSLGLNSNEIFSIWSAVVLTILIQLQKTFFQNILLIDLLISDMKYIPLSHKIFSNRFFHLVLHCINCLIQLDFKAVISSFRRLPDLPEHSRR